MYLKATIIQVKPSGEGITYFEAHIPSLGHFCPFADRIINFCTYNKKDWLGKFIEIVDMDEIENELIPTYKQVMPPHSIIAWYEDYNALLKEYVYDGITIPEKYKSFNKYIKEQLFTFLPNL